MRNTNYVKQTFVAAILYMAFTQIVLADNFSNKINVADNKVILQQYDEAIVIYQDIIDESKSSVIEAYAYYKLGTLYTKLDKLVKAKTEYKKGLISLKNAGQANHKIGDFLIQALDNTG